MIRIMFCWKYRLQSIDCVLHLSGYTVTVCLLKHQIAKIPNSLHCYCYCGCLTWPTVKQSDKLQLQNSFTTETKLMPRIGRNRRLTHVVKGRSKSRNHNKRNLITAIKQEKGKHRRALMPGHLKCLRCENIFAHKALWWWPCLFQHTGLLSV